MENDRFCLCVCVCVCCYYCFCTTARTKRKRYDRARVSVTVSFMKHKNGSMQYAIVCSYVYCLATHIGSGGEVGIFAAGPDCIWTHIESFEFSLRIGTYKLLRQI